MIQGIGFSVFNTGVGRAYTQNNRTIGQAVERLSTGLKINRAKDDVASVAMYEALTASFKGIEVAEKNIGNGVSMVQTADSALGAINTELQEIKALTVQANNDALSTTEKQAIQDDIDAKLANINSLSGGASFNGKNLLDGSSGSVSIQTGSDSGDTTSVDLSGNFGTASTATTGNINEGNTGGALGEPLNNINVVSGDIDNIQTGIDNAIDNVTAAQSELGAKENALTAELEGLSVKKEAVLTTRSRVADANFASEASNAIKGFILRGATASLSSQANFNAKLALNLLPLVR